MHYHTLLTFAGFAAASPFLAGPGLGGGSDTMADRPDPKQIQIVKVETSGAGCRQGTVSSVISQDATVVTFGFDDFQTYIGPGSSRQDQNKACSLHLSLKYPGGFQFSVVKSTYHGYARLDPGVTGTFLSTYFFSQDASATTTTQTSISGVGQWVGGSAYTKTDEVPTASVIWAPCGADGILNINNRIALTANNTRAKGEITNDDATVAFTQQLNLSWRSCKMRKE